jgi:hypothetical protein
MVTSIKTAVGGKLRSLYRAIFTTQYDLYDTEPIASLRGTCIFCDIVAKTKEERGLWYEDDQVMVFEDIQLASACHGLVIQNATSATFSICDQMTLSS